MSWSSTRRVLCVRLDTVGDVLMTTPALRALKKATRSATSPCSPRAPARSSAAWCPRSTTSGPTTPPGSRPAPRAATPASTAA
ncbi:hypothetical protein [Nannocystis pusilla]|uniref:hypothetical protein n=1 Tax=Nannocystis pusilla TaxID=889268 RepID=UPI003B77FC1E